MVAGKTRVRGTIRSVSMTRANDVARFTRTSRTLRSKSIRELAKRFARYYPPRQLRLANALAFNDPDTLALVFPLNRRNIVITTYFSLLAPCLFNPAIASLTARDFAPATSRSITAALFVRCIEKKIKRKEREGN